MTNCKVTLFDSMRGDEAKDEIRLGLVKTMCKKLDEALRIGFAGKYKGNLELFEYMFYRGCPWQDNGYDCGVYVLKFMDYCGDVDRKLEELCEFDSPAERQRIALEIFEEESNSVKCAVLSRVDEWTKSHR